VRQLGDGNQADPRRSRGRCARSLSAIR